MSDAAAPFDRPLIDARRRRAARTGAPQGADFLLRSVAEELADRLSFVDRHFETVLELGGHSGLLAERLASSSQCGVVYRAERLMEFMAGPLPGVLADEEALPFGPESLDLVVSPLSLHLVNDVPGALIQMARALKPDGLLLGAVLGGETLHELRAALRGAEIEIYGGLSPRVSPFAEVRDVGSLLQRAGLALPVTDQDRLTVRYDSLLHLARDLRVMGMTNPLAERSRRPVSRRFFLRAAELYAEQFADPDGRVRATFDVIYLSGWKPHESQQKPLRPGSAKTRLADVLNDRSAPGTDP